MWKTHLSGKTIEFFPKGICWNHWIQRLMTKYINGKVIRDINFLGANTNTFWTKFVASLRFSVMSLSINARSLPSLVSIYCCWPHWVDTPCGDIPGENLTFDSVTIHWIQRNPFKENSISLIIGKKCELVPFQIFTWNIKQRD